MFHREQLIDLRNNQLGRVVLVQVLVLVLHLRSSWACRLMNHDIVIAEVMAALVAFVDALALVRVEVILRLELLPAVNALSKYLLLLRASFPVFVLGHHDAHEALHKLFIFLLADEEVMIRVRVLPEVLLLEIPFRKQQLLTRSVLRFNYFIPLRLVCPLLGFVGP